MRASRIAAAATLAGVCLIASPHSQSQPAMPNSVTPWVQIHSSRVRMLGSAAAPGRPYLVGVEIEMAEGWKTYWRMPGDAGVSPAFDWQRSANVASVKVLYPAPMRMPEAGGETIGYKRSVLFPIEVTPEDPTKSVKLELGLEFGLCRDICIPAETTLALTLQPGKAVAVAPEIAAAIERVPRPQAGRRKDDPNLERAAIDRSGGAAKLAVEARYLPGAKGADLFIEAPDGLYVPLPRKLPGKAGGLVRFEVGLSRDLDQSLKGKALTLTMVADGGASEAQWTVP
jgi:DsbC/DsbD-like thiol-disulfide interchange protein